MVCLKSPNWFDSRGYSTKLFLVLSDNNRPKARPRIQLSNSFHCPPYIYIAYIAGISCYILFSDTPKYHGIDIYMYVYIYNYIYICMPYVYIYIYHMQYSVANKYPHNMQLFPSFTQVFPRSRASNSAAVALRSCPRSAARSAGRSARCGRWRPCGWASVT